MGIVTKAVSVEVTGMVITAVLRPGIETGVSETLEQGLAGTVSCVEDEQLDEGNEAAV